MTGCDPLVINIRDAFEPRRCNAVSGDLASTSNKRTRSMDAASLRAEIKSWERQFKGEHGRDASIDDIKLNVEIGTLGTDYMVK